MKKTQKKEGRTVRASPDERKKVETENGQGKAYLQAAFKGLVLGRLPEAFPAIILARQPALDPRIVAALFDSFGQLERLQLVSENDTKEFTIEVDDPTHPRYKPFFFNRGKEYGQDHSYYEALCHTQWVDSSDPADHFLETASARYSDRKHHRAIGARLVPATVEVNAFVDAVRAINVEFLDHLYDALVNNDKVVPHPEREQVIRRFIEGVWRNCAVQFHFGGESRSALQTMHLDHVNSSLHMAVTLNGRRTVAFAAAECWSDALLEMNMEKGDVYLTAPAAVLHGIGVQKSRDEERSVALQLRTLLSVEDANALQNPSEAMNALVETILSELDLFQGRIRMPNLDEWQDHLRRRLAVLQAVQQSSETARAPGKVEYTNLFRPSQDDSQPAAEGTQGM